MNNVLRQKKSNVKVEIAVFPTDTKYAVILHLTYATAGHNIKRVILTHEAGRDGFWLAHFLVRQGVEVQM